jgi:hypothetical protein
MMENVRILMCGSRTWRGRGAIYAELERLRGSYGERLVVIHGDEPNGADQGVHTGCEELGIRHEMYCAAAPRYRAHVRFTIEQVSDWKKDGLSAGPKRNKYMLDTGVLGVVAFRSKGRSSGTDGMCALAREAQKPIIMRGES